MKNNSGVTLIELLIYSVIFVIAAGLLTTILVTTTRVTNTEMISTQVGQELNLILTTVQRLVRDASLIECVGDATNITDQTNCSLSTTPGSFLRLRFKDSAKDPTCIYLDADNIVKVAEGHTDDGNLDNDYLCDLDLANATNLTTDKVTAAPPNFLIFTKYDIPGGHATVQIDAQLTYNSTDTQFQISRTLRSAVGRVSAATFDSDLLPNLDNTYSIGLSSPSRRWKNVFSDNIYVTGNVGIGTTNPLTRLEVNDTGTGVLCRKHIFSKAAQSLYCASKLSAPSLCTDSNRF